MELINSPEDNLKLDSKFVVEVVVELMKQNISARYKQTGEVTDKDWEFCEKINWHPVDELPMKPEHIEELKMALKETPIGHKASVKFLESLR